MERHFRWSPENEVFLADLDAEHRELFQIGEGLETAIEGGAPREDVNRRLEALSSHLLEHFSHEEWLMQSVGYNSYGWHKQQHDTARRRLKLFAPLIERGEDEAAALFLEFLAGWLQDHTSVTDRMMGAFVRNYERAHSTKALERWPAVVAEKAKAVPREPEMALRLVHFCKFCGASTTHEARPDGMVCIQCHERTVGAELDRD